MKQIESLKQIKLKLNNFKELNASETYELIKLIQEKEKFNSYEIISKNDNEEILSVKRFSDNQIFSVGEIIIYTEVFPKKEKIKRISLHNGEILIHKDYTMNSNSLFEIWKNDELKQLQELNKGLLKSNDSLRLVNEKIDSEIVKIQHLIDTTNVILDSNKAEIKRLKLKKYETYNYVNSLSDDSIASEFTKYINKFK